MKKKTAFGLLLLSAIALFVAPLIAIFGPVSPAQIADNGLFWLGLGLAFVLIVPALIAYQSVAGSDVDQGN